MAEEHPDFEFRGNDQGLNLPAKLRTPGELIDILIFDEFNFFWQPWQLSKVKIFKRLNNFLLNLVFLQ